VIESFEGLSGIVVAASADERSTQGHQGVGAAAFGPQQGGEGLADGGV
jgi:hypothetical protein